MRSYLKRWKAEREGTKDGIWVKNQKSGAVFFVSDLNNIAQKRYFYELSLEQYTFALLRYRYDKYPECKSALEFLSLLVKVEKYKENKLPKFEELSKFNKNVLEDEYSRIEGFLAIILTSIDEDLDKFIQDLLSSKSHLEDLILLFIVQAFRTKKMRETLSNKMKTIFIEKQNGESIELTSEQKSNYLKASSYLDSISTTSRIVKGNYSIELLRNENKAKFVTSDTPAIVTKYNKGSVANGKFELEGFMPLNPTLAMVVRGHLLLNKNLVIKHVSQKEVLSWNKIMKSSGCTQVYSQSKIRT